MSSSPWGNWGTKLNVTSIVSQGLEQVRSLREDVEKSFDQVVTGPSNVHVSPSFTAKQQEELENKACHSNEVITQQDEVHRPIEMDDVDKVVDEERTDESHQNGINDIEEEMTMKETKESDEEQENDVLQDVEEHESDGEEQKHQDEKIVDDMAQFDGDTMEMNERGDESSEDIEEMEEDDGEVDVAGLQKKLKMRESQLVATSSTIRKLHDELDKICHRKVVAVERAELLEKQLEDMRCEVAEMTKRRRDTRSSQSADMQALQMALAEKEEKLSALLDEGQALSVKQAQLEQRLRSLRKEKDEVDEGKQKAESQVEALDVELKDVLSKLMVSEKEKTRLVQENRQYVSNADAANVRIEMAEQNALEATQQLEKLQTQMEDLTRTLVIKNEEIERLKTAAWSSEASNRENAELQQTLEFLQDNGRKLEKEAARREEMARAEIADLKRKWQDAVARLDMLGQSVSEATQPLFRQIHALQSEHRARQEAWKMKETTLVSRIEEATEQRRLVEQEKLDMKQQLHELEQKVKNDELEFTRIQMELARYQDAVKSAKAEVRELRGRADALQIDFDEVKRQRDVHKEAKEQLEARLDSVEKSSRQLQASSKATVELQQSCEREAQLRQDLEWHQQELQRLQNFVRQLSAPLSTNSASSQLHDVRRMYGDEQPNDTEIVNGEVSVEASVLSTMETAHMTDACISNSGNTSMLELSQLQQRLRLREGENQMLKQQLETLEARQKQTTADIVRLSTRNALLESGETQRVQAESELAKLQKHQVVLLELFGEKEEQVEELQAEVKELKAFYQKQLDTLAVHNEEQQKQRAQ